MPKGEHAESSNEKLTEWNGNGPAISSVATLTAEKRPRIVGIDSIRFLCAMIVLLGHTGIIPPDAISDDAAIPLRLVKLLIGCLFNGPAAVTVFFIISGFCIHYPYAGEGKRLLTADVTQFYVRRLVRIGVPAFAAVILYVTAGTDFGYPNFGVLWSIICEAVYYLLYPALLVLGRKWGWNWLVGITWLVAIAVGAANLQALQAGWNGYNSLGLWTWIIGLPCWLLGCLLAERWARFRLLSISSLWTWRLTLIGISIILRAIKFHVHEPWASNVFTLNIFVIIVYFWLGFEIRSAVERGAPPFLEWLGKWSYSLYLVHPAAAGALVIAGASVTELRFGYYPLVILVGMTLSLLFFYLIELPSHRLAITLSRLFGHKYKLESSRSRATAVN